MRVGFSTSVIQKGKTGVARYVFSLLRAMMTHQEFEFVLFVLEEDRPLFDFAKDIVEVIPVAERHRPPIQNILWHQTALPQLAQAHRLDVIHVPSYRRMLWGAPCPRVTTIHDLAAFHVAGKYDWMRMMYGRYVAARLARRQEELIAVSGNTAQDMEKFWGIPRERVSIIHHGMDLERFSAKEIPMARLFCRHQFEIEKPFFLYVARLEHPGKNHVNLIEAFTRFKRNTQLPWQLVLAGSDWHGAEAIHAAAARSSARDDIRCLGFVSDDELPMLYRAAGVFVYPSLHEGFGMPPLEAMACGCPVICSTRGALGEVTGNAAMTVDPEDVLALARSMTELATDENRREALRQKGLAHSRQFDWQQAATKTLGVYDRAVKRWNDCATVSSRASESPRAYRGYAQPNRGIGFNTRFES